MIFEARAASATTCGKFQIMEGKTTLVLLHVAHIGAFIILQFFFQRSYGEREICPIRQY